MPYFLLAEPVRVDDLLLNRLLGLAVETPENPIGGAHMPLEPLKPRDGVDYLYPRNYVVCKDFNLVLSRSKDANAEAMFERLAALSLKKGGSQTVTLEAAAFRRVSMDNARTKLEELLTANPPAVDFNAQGPEEASRQAEQLQARAQYREQVLRLLSKQDDGTLGIITSFITCTDLAKNHEKSKSALAEAAAGTGPAGLSTWLELGVGAGYSRTKDVGTQGVYEGEYLIACSYLPLYASEKKSTKIPLLPYKIVSVTRRDSSQLGDQEMWRVGNKSIEGDMAATLGGDDEEVPTEATFVNDEEEEAYAFSLIYEES